MSLLPCIYCRRAEVPRTREHVLQYAFGASATLPTQVCAECNSAFSAIDKCFVEGVQFFHTHKNMLRGLGYGRVMRPDGIAVVARRRPDGMGEFPPQMFQSSPTTWTFTGHRYEDHARMLSELAEPSQLSLSTRVVAADEGWPSLTIIRSSPRTFLIQGTDATEVERFCGKIAAQGMKPDWVGEPNTTATEDNPPIHIPTELPLDTYSRAMAKIALNYVCYRAGAEVALRSEFDAVRAFARIGEGNWFDFVVPTLLNHELLDYGGAFFAASHHGVLLFKGGKDGGRKEAAFIVIEGKTVGRVDLTHGAGGLTVGTWILLSRFDPEQRSVEDFTLPDDMPRAVVNPGALGLQDVWPKEWS